MKIYFTRYFTILAVSLLILTTMQLFSQNNKQNEINDGTEYWFGLPNCLKEPSEPIRNGQYPIMLWISSKVNTKATVKADAIGFEQTVPINKNVTTVVELNDYLMNKESEVIKDYGIHIKSDAPITVCVYMSYKWSGEAFRCIPVEWLGKKYVSTNLYLDKTDEYKPGQILIIATEDRTSVTYIPAANTFKVNKKIPKTITLNRGQTFLIMGRIIGDETFKRDNMSDLTGTIVEANKPIAVISGHTKGAFPRYQSGMPPNYQYRWANFIRNMLIEMIWPVELLGKEYISAPIKYFDRTRGLSKVGDDYGDMIRFIASQDNTEIYQMRQDGTGFYKIGPTLKKGQWYSLDNMEDAALYRATKPILTAQYGKTWMNEDVPGGDDYTRKKGDEAQNPHLCGQGMLLVLAPIDHWCSYAQFKSPPATDDFVYVTFKEKDKNFLKFDGQSFMAIFGSVVHPIKGTEYVYVTETVSAGDHFITADSGAKFAAYAYGNWDRTKDGFAYGYPTGINYASPCVDSLYVVFTQECGDVVAKGYVVPPDSSCAIIFGVTCNWDSTENYDFSVDNFDRTTAKQITYRLKVIDKQKPAKAIVTVMSRSGMTVTNRYEYYPEQITAEPAPINFGLLHLDSTSCVNVTLKNPGDYPTTVKELKLKFGKPEFKITAKGLPVTIPAKGEVTIEVCATALDIYKAPVRDTIIAVLSCFEKKIVPLELTSGAPVVWISDADWGQVFVGTEKSQDVKIVNQGTVPVEIYTIDWPDKLHFKRYTGLNLPLTLDVGKTWTFQAYYQPDVPGVQHTTRADFTANTTETKLYSDWTGIGINAGPLIIGYDWGPKRVIDKYADSLEYHGYVIINNTGNTNLAVETIKVQNDPDGVFRIDLSRMPNQLIPNDPIVLDAWFAPKAEKTYKSIVKLYTKLNNNLDSAFDYLQGIGTQPHVAIKGYDFCPEILVGNSKTGVGKLTSVITSLETSMPLKVRNLVIEGADFDAFQIDPQFFVDHPYPIILNPEENLEIPLIFTATHPGLHIAIIRTESDAPVEASDALQGCGMIQGIGTTDWDFKDHYITQTSSHNVLLENNGSEPVTVTGTIMITGKDASKFRLDKYYIESTGEVNPSVPFDLAPDDKLICDVTYMPDEVGKDTARIDYITSVGNDVSNLWGEGKIIRTIASIPTTYKTIPGYMVEVEVDIENYSKDNIVKHDPSRAGETIIDENKLLNDANILAFDTYVTFNTQTQASKDYDCYPNVSGPQDIKTQGTLTDGWTVKEANIISNETLHCRFEGTKPLNGPGILFKFDMRTFLSSVDTVVFPVRFEPDGRPYVLVDDFPGKLIIQPVCVNTMRLIKVSGTAYALAAAKPNPTTGITSIEYAVGLEGYTTVELFDNYGVKAATLVNQVLKPGNYEVTFDINALKLPSGVYQYRIESGPYTSSQSMVIVK
jgi:hypothetical protein